MRNFCALLLLALLCAPAMAQDDAPQPFGRFIRQIEGVWPEHVYVWDDGRIAIWDGLERGLRFFDSEGNEKPGAMSTGAPPPMLEAIRLKELKLTTGENAKLQPRPVDLAIGDDLRMYVVDAANHRVVCLDARDDETQFWSIGGLGTNPGQFVEPTAVAVVPGEDTLLVTDAQNHRAQAFDLKGNFKYEWGKHAVVPRQGEGKIHYPNDIAVSPDGSFVVVAEVFERRVQIFGRLTGKESAAPAAALPPQAMQSHFGRIMAVDGRLGAVWEPELRRVLVFDMGRSVPIHITSFGSYGTKFGEFTNIAGMAIDEAQKRVYVLDNDSRKLDVVELAFDPEAPPKFDPRMAKFVRTVPLGDVLPKDAECGGLAKLPGDVLAIIDTSSARIHEISTEGELKRTWSTRTDSGSGSLPIALAADPRNGRIFIVDDLARGVAVFSSDRKRATDAHSGGMWRHELVRPTGVCIGADGSIYVTDAGADSIIKLDENGNVISHFGISGTEVGELWMPSAIGIDNQNRVVVLDYGNHRGQLFSTEGEWLVAFSAGRARSRTLKPPVVTEDKPD